MNTIHLCAVARARISAPYQYVLLLGCMQGEQNIESKVYRYILDRRRTREKEVCVPGHVKGWAIITLLAEPAGWALKHLVKVTNRMHPLLCTGMAERGLI